MIVTSCFEILNLLNHVSLILEKIGFIRLSGGICYLNTCIILGDFCLVCFVFVCTGSFLDGSQILPYCCLFVLDLPDS